MEALSYQITIQDSESEKIVDEILVKSEEDGEMQEPPAEELTQVLETIRDNLAEEYQVYGKLTAYKVERTLVAEVEAAEKPASSSLILP